LLRACGVNHPNRKTLRIAQVAAAVSCAVIVTAVAASAITLPADFEDTLIANVSAPTALAFTPDGRLLITTQTGTVRVYADGALLASPALNLAAKLCTNSERGVLGIAVDPAFATSHFIYLYYTFNRSGVCENNTAKSPVNRVARFTLSDSNSIDPASELVLVDNIPSPAGNHNAGDLKFGKDGFLYISVGDGGCDYLGDSGCQGANDASRDQHVLLGKILRITKTGGIPASNPFLGADSVRCNTTGRANPGQRCQETFAWGFRNPFRMAFDPNASATRFYINDVGQNTWEEIDLGTAGADFGWNVREGHCANGSTTNCGTPPAGMTNPIYDYDHTSGCASITGGAFVPNGNWPAAYDGTYLFSDYVCGTIFLLTPASGGSFNRTTFASGLGGSSAVAMQFGPYLGAQALYYTSYANGGQVRVISFTQNRAPQVHVQASPTSGQPPLAVAFDGSATTDPDGDALTFDWDFDDGSPHALTASATHTYKGPGHYVARLTVRDSRGATASATVSIAVGNTPPSPTIVAPSATSLFNVGQTITLTGSATDAEDGTLGDAQLTWAVILHHNTHTHPFVPPTSGNHITFTAPAPEDLAATATSYLEIQLTATDSGGLSTTRSQSLNPRIVNVTFQTDPAGRSIVVNNTPLAGPTTVKSWANYALRVEARTQTDSAGTRWLFADWSDGGAAAHIITTPTAPATYAAHFAAGTVSPAIADSYVRGGTSGTLNYGLDPVLLTKLSGSADSTREAYLKFDLAAFSNVSSALLRVYGAIDDTASTNISVAVFPAVNTTWSETGLTGNNRPPTALTPLASTVVVNATANYYEWNVTAWLKSERAAGRSVGTLVLKNTTASSSRVQFNSRQAATNRPELVAVQGTAPPPPPMVDDVVLYASDVQTIHGAWTLVADSTAAGGSRLRNPDAGAAKVAVPAAAPANYFEMTFTATANTAYRLWIRGKADANAYANDSAYVQFSDAVTSTGAAAFRINSATATTYILEDCSGCLVSGWGWQDNAYGTGSLGQLIYFANTGTHTIRVQQREDGLSIDQIVLSPQQYLQVSPGQTKNDATVIPK